MEYSCRNCKFRLSEECVEDEMRRKCSRFYLDVITLNKKEQRKLKLSKNKERENNEY